jgi:long-chain acyl-CoA synthetase
MNVAEMFKMTAKRLPEKPMVIFRKEEYSFQKIDRMSERLAKGLQSMGIKKGDVISVGLPNSPDIVIAFLAAAKIGTAVIPLNTMLKEKELGYIFQDCFVKASITFRPHAEIIDRLKAQGISAPQPIVVGEGVPHHWLSLESLLSDEPDESPLSVSVDREDAFLIVYTSGTTGTPKGVILTHNNVLSVAHAVAEFQQRTEHDCGVCFFPLTHITGIVNFIVDSLSIGSTIILQERFDVEDFLMNFGKYRCTVLGAVNPVFQAILSSSLFEKTDFRNLRLLTSGGASLPVDLYQRLKKHFGVPILEMYGMTENAATLTSNPMEKQKEGSVGVALPGMSVSVIDKEGNPAPPGEVGEVVAKGPGIMKGYFNNPEMTEKAIRNGWYHTGDLGKMDEDGFLYIFDRKDDMINAGAFKIYPRDVEETLYTHPAVQDCAVIRVTDERLGQIPVAFVVLKEGTTVTAEDMIRYCKERMANYKVPRRFHFRKELPRTAQGKVMKRFLEES